MRKIETVQNLIVELHELMQYRKANHNDLPDGIPIQRFYYVKEHLAKLMATHADYLYAFEHYQTTLNVVGYTGWGFQVLIRAAETVTTSSEARYLFSLDGVKKHRKVQEILAQKMLELSTDVSEIKAFFSKYLEES